jgi:subtilisin family serine protease/photosystem II stability/assembly factor-like uncharacterized protein
MRAQLIRVIVILLSVMPVAQVHAAGSPRRAAMIPSERDHGDPADIVPGIVIIKFRRGAGPAGHGSGQSAARIVQQMQALGVRSVQRVFSSEAQISDADAAAGRVDLSNTYYAAIDLNADPMAVAKRLLALDDVEYAEPKFLCHTTDDPNDSEYVNHQEAYFAAMHAPEAWSLTHGDSNVVIAVVDGGTFWQHPDIFPNLHINAAEDINHSGHFEQGPPPAGDDDGIDEDNNGYVDDVIGWNFANNSNDPRGLSSTPIVASHGTATASVAGAATNNLLGIAGAGWRCRVMPICASAATHDNDIAFGFEGIQYAFRNGAAVINCSWGRRGFYSQFEQDVVSAAAQAGALVVVAAGNDNANNDFLPNYPASYAHALAVGATSGSSDVKPSFSNYGVTVPVYAPGANIWIALTNGSYGSGSGTSFASPIVAGLAGLVKSLHPAWTPSQVAAQIRTTCDSIDALNGVFSGSMGRGRINYLRAVTEEHAGLEVVDAIIQTTSGSSVFVAGDTVVIRVTMKNLMRPANNLMVTATPSDASLRPLRSSAALSLVDSGAQVTLPDLMFIVDTLSSPRAAFVKLTWVSNANERDLTGFRLYLFVEPPAWELEATPLLTTLMSVRAVTRDVAWVSGGDMSASAPMVTRTVDGGSNWTIATGNLAGADLWCITAVDSLHAWVGTGDGRIFATTNGGVHWDPQLYPGTQSPFIDGIWFFDTRNGYALGDPGGGDRFVLLQTTDGGNSWVHLLNEPVGASGEAGWSNSFWWTDNMHGWFGTNMMKVWRTIDGGASWQSTKTGSWNSIALAFKDDLNGIVGHDDGALWFTTDGGQSWNKSMTAVSGAIRGVAYLPGTTSAWIVTDNTPYRSTDGGISWDQQASFPIRGYFMHVSFVDTTRGWGITSDGEILRYRLPEQSPPRLLPERFTLYQNFPNPFNGSTSIQFDLRADSNVEIRLYDILGRLVRTIFNGIQGAGSRRVSCDAAGLASGVYFYRIVANPLAPGESRFEATGKMILIR